MSFETPPAGMTLIEQGNDPTPGDLRHHVAFGGAFARSCVWGSVRSLRYAFFGGQAMIEEASTPSLETPTPEPTPTQTEAT